MEVIDNLELLKVGDYIKIYKGYVKDYFISVITKISNEEVIYNPIKQTTYNSYRNYQTGEKESSFILNREKDFRIIKKNYITQKKKKLKDKKYSFNERFFIFKLSKIEGERIIKEEFIKLLK
jgi:hypothetical protein